MLVLTALLCAAAVLVATVDSSASGRVRLARVLLASVPGRRRGPVARLSPGRRQQMVALFAGGCLAVVVGGVAGLIFGLLAAVGCERGLRRLEPRAVRRRRGRLAMDMPIAADLLAACLLSGSSMVDAAESVAAALSGPLEGRLRGVVASVRLGADPAAAWLSLADEPTLAPLGRTVARAVESGSPLAEAMARLADDQRDERRRAAAATAQRAGVRATMPLGACFLPAFVLLGVLPVIGAVAGRVLTS